MVDSTANQAETFKITSTYSKYVLGLLLVVAIFNYADRYMLGILLPAIKDELGLSDTQIGFITGAAFTIFYAFLGVPIASLADRYSRKKIIAAALAVWSAMTCLCGAAQSFLQLAFFRVMVGVGEAGCTPPSHSLISDYYPASRRTSALAIFGLESPLGVFIGFPVHYVRYEDLVNDFENQVRQVLDFLGLDWDDKIASFHQHAQNRDVRTASSRQVTQPLYKTALARWQRYEKHLQPHIPALQPFIDTFGYSPETNQ